MKVYVVKRDDGCYMTKTRDFINSIWQAELFDDLELACCYTPTECNVVECALMTPTEFQDYTKQVRKEVCDKIKKQIKNEYVIFDSEEDRTAFNKILKQIQGN